MNNSRQRASPLPVSIACLLAAASLTARAANYYVEIAGTDDETVSGLSTTSAWRTVGYALGRTVSGDVINVGLGTFPEWVAIPNAITLSGSDIYHPASNCLHRHQSLTVLQPPNSDPERSFVEILSLNVTIQNLTIDGDCNHDGTPDAKAGIHSLYRSLTVSNCVIANLNGMGIQAMGTYPLPSPSDPDSLRNYFGYNMITNISRPTNGCPFGIFMMQAPATCEHNEFVAISGTNTTAGIYLTKCYYTTGMSQPLLMQGNYFDNCVMGVWANYFGNANEPIIVRDNVVTNSVIGIRVTAALGRASISNNLLAVCGVSPSPTHTPARGIWIEADQAPWDPISATDHLLVRNTVVDTGTNSGSVGLLLTYMTQEWPDRNNGVRATVLNNVVDGFDYGVFMESGTNGVSNPTSNHLVDATFHLNDIDHSSACALFTTGITWTVNATTNWLGSYADPSNFVSAAVDYRYWPLGRFYTDTDHDGVMDAYDGDDDADGLSDTAELSIGTMPDRWDTDMDGMNDGAEWIVAGTDPKNPLSVLHLLSIAPVSASQFTVKWNSVAGRWYAVSRTTNINVKSWIVLTNRMAATAPTNSFVDATAAGLSPCYYRVSVTNQ